MKKEYIISRIEASQDGAPYVYVTLSDPNDYKGGAEKRQNPFGPNIMAFTSPEDLMKNLPKLWEIFLWLWEGAVLSLIPLHLRSV
jgi:hypothetical protein